jgi:PAB1-binding protein PBP1
MGGMGDPNAWQRFNFGTSILATGAFWNSTFYLAGNGGTLQAFSLNPTTAQMNTLATSTSSTSFGFPGATPSVSSTPDNTNGIVWALNNSQYCTPQSAGCGPAVLHAYDASNLAIELWNSTQGSGNSAGYAVKFTVPTVANGKVYVGTRGNNTGDADSTSIPGELDVYGLLCASPTAAPENRLRPSPRDAFPWGTALQPEAER